MLVLDWNIDPRRGNGPREGQDGRSVRRGRQAESKGSALGGVHRRRAHCGEHAGGSWLSLPFTPVLQQRDHRYGPLQSSAQLAGEGAGKLRDVRTRLWRSLDGAIGRKGRRDHDHCNDVSTSPHGIAQYPAPLRDRQATVRRRKVSNHTSADGDRFLQDK